MRKILLFALAAAVAFAIAGPGAWAQQSASDEFTLEEITVTAEKRPSNLQELPSSVVALPGDDIVTQGKITTEQILQDVPNLTFRDGGAPNPLGNIAVRGIQRTQEAGGVQEVLPAVTAVYVDGVYLGIGGNYDVDRVEVLRGPQGTLYGRSATAGVVAFHTKNPKLEELGGNVIAEFGSDALVNIQGAINVPVGEKVAMRAAGHYYSRDGYLDEEGGQTKTKEGRIKVLYQPTDVFDIVLSGSMQETVPWGGGQTAVLDGPNSIDYDGGNWTEPAPGDPEKTRQFAVNANYDFGNSTLTYVGGFHDFDYSGVGAEGPGGPTSFHVDVREWPVNDYYYHEARLASDTEGSFLWLVGANYFKHKYDFYMGSYQTRVTYTDPEVSAEDAFMVAKWDRTAIGTFDNYGIFTEETFNLRDDFRITAGLRYDNTEVVQSMWFRQNQNLSAAGTSMTPYIWSVAELIDDTHEYDNITYKLRFEYDLTPDNMVYLMTATGFLPGTASLSPGAPGEWNILILEQQELVSYEVGSKNQFLDNTLRLNGALFYYDYEGLPEAVNINPGGGPPSFTVMPIEVDIMGLELEAEYLITMYDKLSLSAGYLNTEITKVPGTMTWVPSAPPGMTPPPPYDTPGSDAFQLDALPGHPDLTMTLAYDHTFNLGDGSTLLPRAELVYTSDYYLYQLNAIQIASGLKPYDKQDALTLCNVGATWISASQTFSVTGYMRNVFDEEYKADLNLFTTSTTSNVGVTPGDPQTWGLMVNYKF